MSLTEDLMKHLNANPEGLTCRQLRQLLPDVERGTISGTLGWLATAGGVVRKPGTPIIYAAVPGYRLRRHVAQEERDARAAEKARMQSPPRHSNAPLAPKPAPDRTQRRPATESFNCRAYGPTPRSHRMMSDQISADVDAYLARGGHIERLPPGACSRPLLDLYE